MSVRFQELIHKYEIGAGAWIVRAFLVVCAVVALALVYDLSAFRNLWTQEGMDNAQLARNIAEGRGYTTDFIRPLSLHLISTHAGETPTTNRVALPENHPDISNAPFYPAVLAGVMKILPFPEADLSRLQSFSIHVPDLWLAVFNQLLFGIAALMLFRLARKLFDEPVAWASTIVFLLTEILWRFTISGLSTILLLIIFLALLSNVAAIERLASDLAPSKSKLIGISVLTGLLAGAAGMTRYSLCCLIIPVLIVFLSSPSPHRVVMALCAVAGFSLVLAPWIVRNIQISGTPFGTAGFAIMETTSPFPENHLQRSVHPVFSAVQTSDYWRKLTSNLRDMASNELLKLGGSWISILFFAGLLVPFRNPVLGRVRLFTLLSLAVLTLAEALGRTTLSTEAPEVNSENLLIIVSPAVFVFGAAFFMTLRDQINLPGPAFRGLLWTGFYFIAGAPLLLTLLAPHPSPLAYPPYYPPWIQQKASAVEQNAAIMSDIPWAVAWYGRRPAVWFSLKYFDQTSSTRKEDFSAVDNLRSLHGLYFSAKYLKVMDIKALSEWSAKETPDVDWEMVRKMVTELGQSLIGQNVKPTDLDVLRRLYGLIENNWVRGGGNDWESFVLGIFVKREVPAGFPLRRSVGGLMPEIFLTESERNQGKAIQSPKR